MSKWMVHIGDGEYWCTTHGNPNAIKSSDHVCPDCNRQFTCTPEQDQPRISPCLADDCISYDPERDLDIKWGFKKPCRTDN